MCGYVGDFTTTCPMCGYTIQHEPVQRSRRSRGGGIGGRIIAAILVIALIAALWYSSTIPVGHSYRTFPREIEYHITRSYTIKVRGGEIDYRFTSAAPMDIGDGEIQDVIQLDFNPPPDGGVFKEGELVFWTGSLSGEMTIKMTLHVKEKFTSFTMSRDEGGDISQIPVDVKKQYLGDEWAVLSVDSDGDGSPDMPADNNGDGIPDEYRIYPSSPQIKEKAREICGEETNTYVIARKLYDYMNSGEFHYLSSRSGLPQTAEETLKTKIGDCDDQSILYISLLRAMGVPAWIETGWLYDPSTGQLGPHAWSDVYIPLKKGGYIIATVDIVNSEFFFRDPYHITDWIDDGSRGYYNGDRWVMSSIATYYFALIYEAKKGVIVRTDDSIVVDNIKESGEVNIEDAIAQYLKIAPIPPSSLRKSLSCTNSISPSVLSTNSMASSTISTSERGPPQ